MESWLLLAVAALLASSLAAVAGTGGGIILLPVLATACGVTAAVPTYAVVQIVGNLSRIWFNRRELSYRPVGWFCLGAIPFAVLGAWIFTQVPETGLAKILGAFLVLSVLWRRLRPSSGGFKVYWFAPIGAIFSVVSAIVGSAGPFLAPFYLTFGLTKGAFIGTEALGTAVMQLVKLGSYHGLGVIGAEQWLLGLGLGPLMIIGTLAGKRLLDRMSVALSLVVIDVALVAFGLFFLLK